MSLSHEHVGPTISGKIKVYVLTRGELLFPLCYEIPCTSTATATLMVTIATSVIWLFKDHYRFCFKAMKIQRRPLWLKKETKELHTSTTTATLIIAVTIATSVIWSTIIIATTATWAASRVVTSASAFKVSTAVSYQNFVKISWGEFKQLGCAICLIGGNMQDCSRLFATHSFH